jgi:hypothetical protein
MNQTDMADKILHTLYEAKFSADDTANLFELRDEEDWDRIAFSKVGDRMIADGLVRVVTAGGNYGITSAGILYAEGRDILPEDLVQANQRLRTQVLDVLEKAYDERGMLNGQVHIKRLMEETRAEQIVLLRNLLLLSDLGYAKARSSGTFVITYEGVDAVKEWREKVAFAGRFEDVEQMEPHRRGREFQKLLAEVIGQYGWFQEESVRTSHEEMDVLVCQGREYYLIECKWEKDPIESSVIRELYGKLGNRVGVQGIAVSMSGFTAGAAKQARDYKNERVILLFGPEDVRSMIFERIPFEELLNQKFRALVTRGEVLFR